MTDKELFFKYNYIDTQNLEKNSLLDKLLKENKLLYKNKQNYPLLNNFTLILNASYNCNANCIYCYNKKLRQLYQNKIIELNLLDEIIDKIGKNIGTILFHGGEPLLLPLEYFQHIVDKKKQYNLSFKIGLQSNGILLSEEKQQFFKNNDISIGFSFDGLFNNNTRGQNSSIAILKLAKQNVFLDDGIITVVDFNNVNNLIENYEFLKKNNFTNVQTHIVHEQIMQTNTQILLDNDIIIENYKKYLTYWIHDTSNPILEIFLQREIEKLFHITQVCTDKNCIGSHFHIDPLGNIGPCGYLLLNKNFGNIKQITNINDIYNNPEYINYCYKVNKLLQDNCQNCIYKEVCNGGCIELIYENDNNLKTMNYRQCDLRKRILDTTYDIIKDLDLSNKTIYNPLFLNILDKNNYYSLTEIKEIEKRTDI